MARGADCKKKLLKKEHQRKGRRSELKTLADEVQTAARQSVESLRASALAFYGDGVLKRECWKTIDDLEVALALLRIVPKPNRRILHCTCLDYNSPLNNFHPLW